MNTVKRAMCVSGLAAAIFCGSAFGDLDSDYQTLFGKDDKKVTATRSKTDDIEFAAMLLKVAGELTDSPKMQVLLYEKAVKFGSTGPAGSETVAQALDLLEKAAPDRKADWLVMRLEPLRNSYVRAQGKAKKPAAEAYLDALVSAGDALMEDWKPSDAMKHYRFARAIASYHRKGMLVELRSRLTAASSAVTVANKMKSLQAKIKSDPDNIKAREDLILLYIIQADSPAKASALMNDDVSELLRMHVSLVAKSDDDLSDKACLTLGDWYYKSLLPQAPASGKQIVLQRADRYYQQYLVLHETQDLSRVKTALALKKISAELARLAPRKTILASRAPKDAVAFGGHRYKVYAPSKLDCLEAVKVCRKLGGNLVTIESAAEFEFLKKLTGSGRLWVGASDQAVEGKWMWLTGKPFSPSLKLWISGEPNEARQANFASITATGLRDNASPSSRVGGFICEWSR